jgi:hypothetical protein
MSLTDEKRAETIKGLRDFADFLEANPEASVPFSGLLAMDFPQSKAEMATAAKGLGGHWEKTDRVDGQFQLKRNFGPWCEYRLSINREAVCERIVKGTREITLTAPDPEAIAALPQIERTETVEDIEWICPPSLLSEVAS